MVSNLFKNGNLYFLLTELNAGGFSSKLLIESEKPSLPSIGDPPIPRYAPRYPNKSEPTAKFVYEGKEFGVWLSRQRKVLEVSLLPTYKNIRPSPNYRRQRGIVVRPAEVELKNFNLSISIVFYVQTTRPGKKNPERIIGSDLVARMD